MYIWVGIDVDEQLTEVRNQALQIDRSLQFQNSCFTLPLHISLKMSFHVDNTVADEVLSTIEQYYRSIEPFEIPVKAIEDEHVIVWIRMQENRRLNQIHDDLNRILGERFGVGLHAYDQDYKFHTTLFMDHDPYRISSAYQKIRDVEIPSVLRANRFVIGISQSGALGTYSVIREVVK